MNTDTENKIVGQLLRTPLISKSMRQIAIDAKLTYVTVHKTIPILEKKKILRRELKGNNHLISVDLQNAQSDDLASAILTQRELFLKKYPKIRLLLDTIKESLTNTFYILLLFGSYAKENQKKNSDVDLLFILPNPQNIREYRDKIQKATQLTTLTQDITVVSIKDYIEMLNQKYTVGREAFESGIVLFGAEHFYSLVKEHARKKGY